MKQLQKDYTTPEQSKRLLKLGIPADSANMGYQALNGKCYSNDMCGWRVSPSVLFIAKPDWSKHEWYPCWSVGRLIEICKICGSYELAKEIYGRALMYLNTVDGCICEMSYEINKGNLDFSKLED